MESRSVAELLEEEHRVLHGALNVRVLLLLELARGGGHSATLHRRLQERAGVLGAPRPTSVRVELCGLERLGVVQKVRLPRERVGRPSGYYALTQQGEHLASRARDALFRVAVR